MSEVEMIRELVQRVESLEARAEQTDEYIHGLAQDVQTVWAHASELDGRLSVRVPAHEVLALVPEGEADGEAARALAGLLDTNGTVLSVPAVMSAPVDGARLALVALREQLVNIREMRPSALGADANLDAVILLTEEMLAGEQPQGEPDSEVSE